MKKNFVGKLIGIGLALLSLQAFASDVGMIEEGTLTANTGDVATAGLLGSPQDRDTAGGESNLFFVHVDGGVLFRNLKDDSGLFCLDTSTSSFGAACSSSQSWKRGQRGYTWSAGIGFRYNAAFALDFAYWGTQKQSTTALTSSSQASLRTWLITGLYQAQLKMFSHVYLMPQIGVAYIYGRSRGVNGGDTIDAMTSNWRPAIGLGILAELSSHFALNLSGLYVPGAGHSPTLGLTYPSIQMMTLGLRYAF